MPDVLEALKLFGPVLTDAWFVVDEQDRIVALNAAFHQLFPRAIARNLKSMTCCEAVSLPTREGDRCLRRLCVSGGPFRLSEIDAEVGGQKLRLVISAVPLAFAPEKVGALIVLRDVTADARVQARYRELVDGMERQRRELEERLEARTRDLLSANEELNRLERELARLRRGGV